MGENLDQLAVTVIRSKQGLISVSSLYNQKQFGPVGIAFRTRAAVFEAFGPFHFTLFPALFPTP